MHTPYLHTCRETYINKRMFKNIDAYAYTRVHNMHKRIHTYTHTHIHTYIHTVKHTYIQSCIHIYNHTHIYPHTHTHTHINAYNHECFSSNKYHWCICTWICICLLLFLSSIEWVVSSFWFLFCNVMWPKNGPNFSLVESRRRK